MGNNPCNMCKKEDGVITKDFVIPDSLNICQIEDKRNITMNHLDDSTLERKEEYKHLPSKFLVHDIDIKDLNNEFSLEIDLLDKIILIQRAFRKRKYVYSKNNNKNIIHKNTLVEHKKEIESKVIQEENHLNNNSSEELKSDLINEQKSINNVKNPNDNMEETRAFPDKTDSIIRENFKINNTSSKKHKVDLYNSKRKSINSTELKIFEEKNTKSIKSVNTCSKDRITVNFSYRGDIMAKSNKYKYIGQKIDGKKIGFGIQIWADNSLFVGNFTNGKSNGYCYFKNKIGSVFKGEYKDNVPRGFGYYHNSNNSKFEGYWENYYQEGIGIEYWPDETYYQGNYSQGKKHGFGIYRWPDGGVYRGNFNYNNMEGYGIFYFSDDKFYIGEWKNNLMDGYGEFSWLDGKKYIGWYLNDKKHGFGIFYWPEYDKAYIGFWKSGKQDGYGMIISKSHVKYGFWENGVKKKSFNALWQIEKLIKGIEISYLKFFRMNYDSLLKFINEDF